MHCGTNGSGSNDRMSNAMRMTFIGISTQHLCQLDHVVLIDDVVCAEGLRLIHSHIERRIKAIRKAAFRNVKLWRGNTEVEEGTGQRTNTLLGHDGSDRIKTGASEGHALAITGSCQKL